MKRLTRTVAIQEATRTIVWVAPRTAMEYAQITVPQAPLIIFAKECRVLAWRLRLHAVYRKSTNVWKTVLAAVSVRPTTSQVLYAFDKYAKAGTQRARIVKAVELYPPCIAN